VGTIVGGVIVLVGVLLASRRPPVSRKP